MSVVRDFCGHGLGKLFHDEPNIVHVGRPGEGIVLRPGMFFTVEPMINLGRPHVKVLSDGWTAVTRDRSLSAQFEHTIGVTANGVEIFTTSPKGLDKPPYGPERCQRARTLAIRLHLQTHCALTDCIARQYPHPDADVGRVRSSMPSRVSQERRRSAGLAEASPHYLGHRERLRERFLDAGPDAVTEYELLELVLFRAIPRRDVKPLAKALIAKFGSFGEVVSAPRQRLREIDGLGRSRHRRDQDRAGGGEPARARRGEEADGAVVVVGGARLLPHHDGVRRQGAVPRAVPRQAQPGHRRRGAADRHRGSHAGLSARGGQARAGVERDRDHPGAQSSQSAIRRRAAPTSR